MLLLSTDPAHSLGDVLGLAIGDRARSVPGAPANLRVRELNAAAAMAARRAGIEAALEEIASAFGAGLDEHRGRGVSELMDLAPPGIDELFAVLSIGELLSPGQDRLVVLDTAPTGHALRLLEMPDTAREWTQVLMRVLLKYRELRGPGKLGAELVSLSKSIRRLGELLHNPRDTRFIVVSRAADVPRLETERLLRALRRMRLAVPALVINAATLAPGRCPRCRATAAAERPQRGALARACRTRSRDCAIILAPLSAPPPRGVAQLEVWARLWSEQ